MMKRKIRNRLKGREFVEMSVRVDVPSGHIGMYIFFSRYDDQQRLRQRFVPLMFKNRAFLQLDLGQL